MPYFTALRRPRGPRSPRGLRGSRLSSRPFYTTVFLLSLLAAYSFLEHTYRGDQDGHLQLLTKRSGAPECADVRRADDQCAFVKEFCVDDDAGLIPYLTFYYCGLGNVKGLAFILLVAWLGLLFTTIGIAASDFFSVNLSTISTMLGLSESLAGVTFLAFGNGSPDVFSTFAAMNSNSASMAVGELIGAASFISGVVAGSMALVREFRVDKKTYARDICFFIVAVGFTMVFLADGHLRFWECWIMIGYYIIYVLTVVGQHWYTTRRKRRLRREGEARSHVYGPVGTSVDELAGEPYRDEPDDVDHDHRADDDVSALEHGPRIEIDGHPAPEPDVDVEEDEEDHERLVAAEVASSMRVLRTRGRRKNTINPIRPSLVGALEFRSALAQLQRESNLRMSTINGHGRSLSEAHLPSRGRRQTTGAQSVVEHRFPHSIAVPDEVASGRARALSSGNQPSSRMLPPEMLGSFPDPNVPQQGHLGSDRQSPSPEPVFTIGGNLAPPPVGTPQLSSGSVSPMTSQPQGDGHGVHPGLHLQIPGSHNSSQSGGSSPSSPFPMYTDSPALLTPLPEGERSEFMLPGPAHRNRSFVDLQVPAEQPRPVRWWPYSVLPPPHVLYATLFPTLQGWKEKTIWDKLVSAISIPSIFLLVITLPVVESDAGDGDSVVDTVVEPLATRHASHVASAASVEPHIHQRESEWQRFRRRTLSRNGSYNSLQPSTTPLVALDNEDTLVDQPSQVVFQPESPFNRKPASEIPSIENANDETLPWNRWLVCLQLFTGPLFSVFILWANLCEDFESPGKVLVRMILYTLLGSFILLAILLVFTTEQRKPKYHYILCFLGFTISIAWISTVAGEVVGVLKTFGTVLGISEALLGLTIFAAGNSVGDLVADITIARLGYPVMAL